jgi:hypothetical protein
MLAGGPDCATPTFALCSYGIVMWELWTGLEPFAGINYHALMMRLASPKERLRPPVPGGPDWEGAREHRTDAEGLRARSAAGAAWGAD